MITVEQVKQALREVAEEQTGQVDARVERNLAPRYVEHGQPCCLVAVVLHRLGFSVAQLKQLDAEPGRQGGGVVFGQSRHPLMRRISADARQLLDYVQVRQDRGWDNWQDIIDRALQRDRYAPDPRHRSPYHHDPVAGSWAYEVFPWNRVRAEGSTVSST
jgi:hypothetical protein